ncbi:MAG TPA: type I DNA topoisomerase, partial [Devosiaceae bacterium]|nr:type I DNA topoisomerase [Devosiaceae bacterium]
MKVVIVESPAKAKTINRYLGSDYVVLASFGHVRDLPSKDGSVKPDEDFEMVWEVDSASRKRLSDIAAAVKDADEVILATDPDREGEAISWHILDVLKSKKAIAGKKVSRVVFNAITKSAVTEAMAHPRDIDEPLVDAYLARRALDYLVGFTLSPILWRKLPGSRSAGRVQSVALRLITEREDEIERFKPQEYWSVTAALEQAGKAFEARLYAVDGNKVDRLDITSEAEASRIRDAINAGGLTVTAVEKKPQKRNPYAPFTTSTLQQDASSRLGFSPSRTMQIAQRLYEGAAVDGESVGLITYMRTDAVQIAPEAIDATRRQIAADFGATYLPEKPRLYQTKAKNAQEAHEAIRPTDLGRHPDALRHLEPEQQKLYELIWKRTMASQMRAAEFERTAVDLALRDAGRDIALRATGSVTTFDGFLRLYATAVSEDDEDSRELPPLAEGDTPALTECLIEQHFTQPPPRYTEASVIRAMEELGIGRPSTYASTLAVLRDRDYVRLEKRTLIPEDR